MPSEPKGVVWEALEHHHEDKKSDWYWAAGILIFAFAIASILFGNSLFGILILTGGIVLLILAAREPKVIPYAVTQRGLRIDDKLYPYTTLEAYFIDEEDHHGIQLLVRSEKLFMPLLILPLPFEYVDEIEAIISARLPESHLEEPFIHRLFEFLGF